MFKPLPHYCFLIGILCALAGCETYQPVTVADGKISNPSMGFNGYDISIPKGYFQVQDFDKSVWPKYLEKRTKHFLQRGGDQTDYVVLSGYNTAMAFIVGNMNLSSSTTYVDHQTGAFTTQRDLYGRMSREQQETYLGLMLEGTRIPNGRNIERKVVLIQGRPVAIISWELPDKDITLMEYETLGHMDELFMIIGIIATSRKAELNTAMNEMVASLKVY